MSFLNSDQVDEAKEKFGAEAESVVEEKVEDLVGKDTADAIVGALGNAIGIEQGSVTSDETTSDAQPAGAPTAQSPN
jgi:hypothetical protein